MGGRTDGRAADPGAGVGDERAARNRRRCIAESNPRIEILGWRLLSLRDGTEMAHSYVMLVLHIVFSTKGRVPFIGERHRDPLYEYIGGIIRSERGTLLAVGGMPDHVHLLARFRASVSVSEMLKLIKGRSSHWMNGLPDLGARFDWQEGYAAFSVSESQIATVRRYILTQEQHHARRTFHQEITTLLRRHGFEFDEQDLLD
jgi:REP-associated tyrosine transposase